MAAKVRTLTAKFNSIEPNIIREMLEECNGDMAEVSRKLTVITGDTAASASPGSAACHPSPQPRSVVEGTNSLDRQQRHRMLVSELAAEFPAVERAVVRRTLASTGWKMAESRQKLKVRNQYKKLTHLQLFIHINNSFLPIRSYTRQCHELCDAMI